MNDMQGEWVLALGGGGIYGIAHLGVLDALKNRLEICGIVGTSAGSIAGACFAAGRDPEAVLQQVEDLNWLKMLRPTFEAGGLLGSEQLQRWISKFVGDISFDDLDIPFAAVATDLTEGTKVVLQEGSVCRALAASSAIPGVFTPVTDNQKVLVDGGVISNVPVDTARELFSGSSVLAVNVSRGGTTTEPPQRTHEVVLRSIQLLQRRRSAQEASTADITITPHLSDIDFLDIARAGDMYSRGREAALEALEQVLDPELE